jgi:hypothetical protein
LVSHRLSRAVYFGCMKTGPVLSSPKLRWHEPEWWRFGENGNKYFRHCSGQIYGVSRLVAQYIHDHSSILHRYANEDVSVGSWVMGLDVEFIDERHMCCQDCRGRVGTFHHVILQLQVKTQIGDTRCGPCNQSDTPRE